MRRQLSADFASSWTKLRRRSAASRTERSTRTPARNRPVSEYVLSYILGRRGRSHIAIHIARALEYKGTHHRALSNATDNCDHWLDDLLHHCAVRRGRAHSFLDHGL